MSKFYSIWEDLKLADLYQEAQKFTKPYATALIKQAGLTTPDGSRLVIFDNACGNGVLSSALHEVKGIPQDLELTCGDISEHIVKFMQQKIKNEGWSGATASVIDAQDTKLPSSTYTHVFTNFAIMLLPEPDLALKEIFRILKPGGTIAFTTWVNPGWISDIRGAMSTTALPPLPPTSKMLNAISGVQESAWDSADYIRTQLTSHGFSNPKSEIMANTPNIQDSKTFVAMMEPMFKQSMPLILGKEDAERFQEEMIGSGGLVRYLEGKYGVGKEVSTEWSGIVTTAVKPME